MRSLKHLNKYFIKYKVRLLLGILFVSLSNYFAVDSIKYVRKGIDYVAEKINTHNISISGLNNELLYYGMMIIGMAALMGLFMFFMRQTIIVMSRFIEYDLKNEIYEHYQKLDQAFYKKNNTGDLMNRISEDVSRVRMYIGPAIMYIVNTVGTFVFTIIVMIQVNPKLTLYVLTPLPVLALSIYMISDTINKKSNKVQEQLSELSTLSQESFSGIRVIKAYVREHVFNQKYAEQSEVYRKKSLSLTTTEALFQPFMVSLIGLSTILTIYIGGIEAIDGKISTGNIGEFILYINRLTWPIASLGWVTSLIQRAAASQERINEFLRTQPAIVSGKHNSSVIEGNIEFINVSLTYPDSGITALKNISFKVNVGESLAIVGKTGSGKSSITALVTRLYDATEGTVLIDGINIKEHNLNVLRSNTGYVPQEVFLFSDTISNNIAFASEETGKEKIEQAAKNAAIYDNIMEFPEKFNTKVGERGITLSGGQKQRISIARAIIKEPKILLFDDCLSAVDTETEETILQNLKRIMHGKTTLLVSHRVSTVKNSNRIIVLDEGKIIEQGTHQQLLDLKGAYFELYQKQLLEEQAVV